jgi:hypothetical protein
LWIWRVEGVEGVGSSEWGKEVEVEVGGRKETRGRREGIIGGRESQF